MLVTIIGFLNGIIHAISRVDYLTIIISILLVIITSNEQNFFYYRLIGLIILIFILGIFGAASFFLKLENGLSLIGKNINLINKVSLIMETIAGFCIINFYIK